MAGAMLCGWGWAQELEPDDRGRLSGTASPTHTFGRGLDLDRGTDLSVSLGGIPANLPSTVWGPGYLDTNYWIADLEGDVQYRRGPHQLGAGGFANAGSLAKELVGRVERPTLTGEFGGAEEDRFGRLLWMDSRPARGATFTYALEATRNARPWDELDPSSKVNAAFRFGREQPERGWNFTVLATREQGDGGAPDPLGDTDEELHEGDGLRTRRLLLGAALRQEHGPDSTTRFQAYGGVSSMNAWGNYTYFLHDEDRGDQRERVDRRGFLGLDASRQWRARRGWFGPTDRLLGFQARVDQVTAAEVYATQDRARIEPLLRGRAQLYQAALFGQSTAHLGRGWTASAALRLDSQRNHVLGAATERNRTATLLSPKLGLACRPGPDTECSLNYGMGFRPGNAFRDSQPLTRSTGLDLGAKTRILGPWVGGITLWALDLEAETGLDPDWNAFVAQGRSRRHGLEWHNLVQWGPWSGELCLAWTRTRFRDQPAGQDHVPGAIGQTGFLALGWKDASRSVKLSLKRLGGYPLNGHNSVVADPQDAVDLKLTQDWRRWSISVGVLNTFGYRKYNQEYEYRSRLAPGSPAVPNRHGKKADPQAVRLEITHRF
jgi:hypothetical protein